jgi:hypothetical protein
MRRLRDKVREDLALRGMSENTILTYVGYARRFAEHFGQSPNGMGAAEIRAFLLHLTDRRVRPTLQAVRLRPLQRIVSSPRADSTRTPTPRCSPCPSSRRLFACTRCR